MSILIGYVPTPEGEAALEAGLKEARLRDTNVVILNSPRKGAPVDAALIPEEQVTELIRRARALGVDAVVRQPGHDNDLTEEFIDLAEEVDASLIVIGLRKRSQVGKFILGSHAQRILLQVDRPVLAVKASDEFSSR
ncbi:MAG: universal stress protein UspA [Micrococcaceae bacterium]|jgi:nucleotide-binding universal stress UspA family protein|uniref:Universal stress protein n=1 Tax=Arthrobacter cheniae TaxID=1258888 RepID=A0A3A5MBS1_9MICC|nr:MULTISPECIES: universal stress protein [Arthrobacter]MCU1632102.1 universal stress protein UspA [Micrococcaceae bacterium]MEC5199454.1 nucleotide-binding universal stress UspA family protein [Arthrobacter sp. PL16]RJT80162.1 universal stress protein [Arthrobacter cheniae]